MHWFGGFRGRRGRRAAEDSFPVLVGWQGSGKRWLQNLWREHAILQDVFPGLSKAPLRFAGKIVNLIPGVPASSDLIHF